MDMMNDDTFLLENIVLACMLEYTGKSAVALSDSLLGLGLDSLDVVKICTILEEKLNRTIEPPKDMRSIKTVGDILFLVETI